MRDIPTTGDTSIPLSGYRLNPGACFLKFCNPVDPHPLDTALIQGLYIPLGYWDIFYESDEALGPRGGRRLTYDNIGRYFDNTLFVKLVQKGWVGAPMGVTAGLRELALASIETGRSLTLASYVPAPDATGSRPSRD